jgi:hypothetical protein
MARSRKGVSLEALSLGALCAALSVLMVLDATPVPTGAPQVLAWPDARSSDTSCSDPVLVCVSGRWLPPKAANTPNSQLNTTIEANKATISRRIFKNMRPRRKPARAILLGSTRDRGPGSLRGSGGAPAATADASSESRPSYDIK